MQARFVRARVRVSLELQICISLCADTPRQTVYSSSVEKLPTCGSAGGRRVFLLHGWMEATRTQKNQLLSIKSAGHSVNVPLGPRGVSLQPPPPAHPAHRPPAALRATSACIRWRSASSGLFQYYSCKTPHLLNKGTSKGFPCSILKLTLAYMLSFSFILPESKVS